MTSPTDKHRKRTAAKLIKACKLRKNKIRRLGTTAPSLPLTKPNAHEKAQKASVKA